MPPHFTVALQRVIGVLQSKAANSEMVIAPYDREQQLQYINCLVHWVLWATQYWFASSLNQYVWITPMTPLTLCRVQETGNRKRFVCLLSRELQESGAGNFYGQRSANTNRCKGVKLYPNRSQATKGFSFMGKTCTNVILRRWVDYSGFNQRQERRSNSSFCWE